MTDSSPPPQEDAVEKTPFETSSFWTQNPWSSQKITEKNFFIEKPWGDDTLIIVIPKGNEAIGKYISDMENIILPKELSAIYHTDLKALEIIFTAAPIDEDLKTRKFKLYSQEGEHECKFERSSERLLWLAERSRPVQSEGASSYRNLPIYTRYLAERKRLTEGEDAKYSPFSFWISDIELNIEKLTKLMRQLNYYMMYFDMETPTIMIHQDVEAVKISNARYLSGGFPSEIRARQIDDTMLDLWEGTLVTDPFVKFIRSFQVLEYAAFYYISSDIRDSVSQIILRPEALVDTSSTIDRILDAVVIQRMDDDSKIKEIVKKQTDINKLWNFIEKNKDYFASSHCFDGGFEIDELIKLKWDAEDFSTSCHPKLTEGFIKIRNNLVHAREKRQSRALFHTNRNRTLIRPWATLINIVAMQVVSTK